MDDSPGSQPRAVTPGTLTAIVLAQGVVFTALGVAIWWGTDRDVADYLRFGAHDLVVAATLGGGLIVLGLVLVKAAPGFLPWAAKQQTLLFSSGQPFSWTQIVLISAAAGIGEEALFRAGLQTLAGDYLPVWAAIAVSSALFAALHAISFALVAAVFVLGTVFGIAYEVTDSLLGVMLAHAVYDVFAIAAVQRELGRQGLLGGEPAASTSSH